MTDGVTHCKAQIQVGGSVSEDAKAAFWPSRACLDSFLLFDDLGKPPSLYRPLEINFLIATTRRTPVHSKTPKSASSFQKMALPLSIRCPRWRPSDKCDNEHVTLLSHMDGGSFCQDA